MSDYDEGYVIIERRTGNFGTFVWGLLLGAGAALLFAPKSGRETREELTESFDRLRDEAEHRAREVQDTVHASLEEARRQFEDGMENARRTVESGREAMRASRDEVERRVRESSEAFRTGYQAARETGEPEASGSGAAAPDQEETDQAES